VSEKTEWKLVPVKPTDEMLDAADVPARVHPDAYFRAVYRAMLAAAPEPPADPRDGEIARLRESSNRAWIFLHMGRPTDAERVLDDALRGDSDVR
jgi:hypothetical protein